MNIANIFDYKRVKQTRDMSSKKINNTDFIHHYVFENLLSCISLENKKFSKILNIGVSSKNVNKLLQQQIEDKLIIFTDISHEMIRHNLRKNNSFVCNPENLPISENTINLVISNLLLHNINDLPGCLIQINRILEKDGVFICSLFGSKTLIELREAMLETEITLNEGHSAHIHPFIDVKDMGKLMQRANFYMPVTDSEIVTVYYDNLDQILKDIRGFGERNAMICRSNKYLGRNFRNILEKTYKDRFTNEFGQLQVSYEIIKATGIKI